MAACPTPRPRPAGPAPPAIARTAPARHTWAPSTAKASGSRRWRFFFDLVFVLAITECTSLMAHHPTRAGLGQGLLVLGVLWWAWASYAWLTSVIDPEAGAVRLVFFAAMASMLVAAICVPEAFGDLTLPFALAIGFFRVAHIALFTELITAEQEG